MSKFGTNEFKNINIDIWREKKNKITILSIISLICLVYLTEFFLYVYMNVKIILIMRRDKNIEKLLETIYNKECLYIYIYIYIRRFYLFFHIYLIFF